VLSDAIHTFSIEAVDSSGNVGVSAKIGIYAHSGDQVITGGPGAVLSGGHMISNGVASDTFVFDAGFGHDIINYFHVSGSNHDVIQFSASLFQDFAAVLAHAAQVGSNVLITADAADTLTIHHAKLSGLHSSDFTFV
jgi:Ca2+-binding RTX toxin-like protein